MNFNQLTLVKSAICFLRAAHREPTCKAIKAAISWNIGTPFRIRTQEMCALMKTAFEQLEKPQNGSWQGNPPETLGNGREIQGTETTLESADSGNRRETDGNNSGRQRGTTDLKTIDSLFGDERQKPPAPEPEQVSLIESAEPAKVPNAAGRKRNQSAKPPADDSWASPLALRVEALSDRKLMNLSADDRFELARYHCLKFANCTKDESKNRQNALKIASDLNGIASSPGFSSLTVGEYIAGARKAWEANRESPLRKAWDVTAFCQRNSSAHNGKRGESSTHIPGYIPGTIAKKIIVHGRD